ncbi:Deacetylase [Archaeoglobus sulfaticallidus PM70-1]|uniref:Deacetylase n=1 Tax=Archaeoglobus sulfaticallidus PM70-1 TaxID=387631 RepID=N0BDI1_9EURY|nr:deacetylase [Archaeoglobus sulfaticallidus]AGK60312.1 Deacetylase [Archaeoglobus sulfaticallidus PM70-1]
MTENLTTGIFYHESFSRRSYLTIGTRLKDFPRAFEFLKKKYSNIEIFESEPVSEDLILKVHSLELLEGVKNDTLCSTAWHSAGGVVTATEKVYKSEIRNAFCFIGAGGHHAGRKTFWGFCCFNDVVLAMTNIWEKYGDVRFAIIDTDAHHGDGTRELIEDKEVLHYCICSTDYVSEDGLKIDASYIGLNPDEYPQLVEDFDRKARNFKPDLIFWYFGHDTHEGDYGDIGLTVKEYVKIAEILKNLAEEICNGKLVVVLGGGSSPSIATESCLAVIEELAKNPEMLTET